MSTVDHPWSTVDTRATPSKNPLCESTVAIRWSTVDPQTASFINPPVKSLSVKPSRPSPTPQFFSDSVFSRIQAKSDSGNSTLRYSRPQISINSSPNLPISSKLPKTSSAGRQSPVPSPVDHPRRMSSKKSRMSKGKASSSSQGQKEEPKYELARKEIVYEKIFPVKEMEERPECKWTLEYLKNNNYRALTMNFDDEVYPRLVKLFYQNMRFDKDQDGFEFFDFSIDGFKRRITLIDIGEITQLPVQYSAERCPHLTRPFEFPNTPGMLEFLRTNFSEGEKKGKGESLILSTLPERVWLLDRILRENVYPLGHHSERRSELLHALYSAHTGHFYSMPFLFMRGIIKMAQEVRTRSPTGLARPLPYGFLITAILRYAGYHIDEDEPELHVKPYFPLSTWIASHTRLLLARQKKKDKKKKEEARTSATASTPPPAPTPSSTSDHDVIARLTKLEKDHRKLRREHQGTDSIVRGLARHYIGQDYQSQIEAFEEEEARKGKAAAAEDSESDSEDETSETESD